MRSLFACPSIIRLMGTGDRQVDHKRTSWRRRIVAKITPKGSHESARKIQPEPRGIGPLLEGLKQLVDGTDARSRIRNPDGHDARTFPHHDIDSLQVGALQGPFAVLGEIQKNLQQTVAIGPDGGEFPRDVPVHGNIRFLAIRLENDLEIVQSLLKVDAADLGIAGALFELEGGNLIERFDQRSERLEVLGAGQGAAAGEVLVDDRDGAAYVA